MSVEKCQMSKCRKHARVNWGNRAWFCKEHAVAMLMQGGIKSAYIEPKSVCGRSVY